MNANVLLRRLLFALLLALPLAAAAQSLDEFRAEGIIAERFDGYVEVRTDDAPAAARRLVEEVNAQRRELYRQRAESQGVPADEVGKVYAETIMERAPAGTYFRMPGGHYVRR
ncbi:YdbL family protein [Sediminicurvatus halobius]|nr:YdbL family protein [Spiribacter halobius]UEX79256.1 YdbL family protein [Spiribacter halobius]